VLRNNGTYPLVHALDDESTTVLDIRAPFEHPKIDYGVRWSRTGDLGGSAQLCDGERANKKYQDNRLLPHRRSGRTASSCSRGACPIQGHEPAPAMQGSVARRAASRSPTCRQAAAAARTAVRQGCPQTTSTARQTRSSHARHPPGRATAGWLGQSALVKITNPLVRSTWDTRYPAGVQPYRLCALLSVLLVHQVR
jgi:hypothetical protein